MLLLWLYVVSHSSFNEWAAHFGMNVLTESKIEMQNMARIPPYWVPFLNGMAFIFAIGLSYINNNKLKCTDLSC